MDEYIDIVDANGNPTGKIALKSEAHKNGWHHITIHLWLYNSNGDILLAQRSHKKIICPLLWDVSAAGHIDAGESFIDAAIRETYEELGVTLKASALKHIGVFKHESEYNNGQIKDYEFHQVFVVLCNAKLSDFKLQAGEVDAIKWVDAKTFLGLLQESETNSHFVASNRNYYQFVLQHITHLTTAYGS